MLSLFFVRIRGKDTDTFRAWGYPWAPAIFCLVSFAIVANTIVSAPGPAFAGLGVMAAGVPIYWWTKDWRALNWRRAVRVGTSAHSVRSASAPSLAANKRNDPGEWRTA